MISAFFSALDNLLSNAYIIKFAQKNTSKMKPLFSVFLWFLIFTFNILDYLINY